MSTASDQGKEKGKALMEVLEPLQELEGVGSPPEPRYPFKFIYRTDGEMILEIVKRMEERLELIMRKLERIDGL